jgi:hypothetical protein
MSNNLESSASKQPAPVSGSGDTGAISKDWLRVGAIAAASALLGGLAAAWFYRKTLSRLQEAEEHLPDSEFIATEDDSPEDF